MREAGRTLDEREERSSYEGYVGRISRRPMIHLELLRGRCGGLSRDVQQDVDGAFGIVRHISVPSPCCQRGAEVRGERKDSQHRNTKNHTFPTSSESGRNDLLSCFLRHTV